MRAEQPRQQGQTREARTPGGDPGVGPGTGPGPDEGAPAPLGRSPGACPRRRAAGPRPAAPRDLPPVPPVPPVPPSPHLSPPGTTTPPSLEWLLFSAILPHASAP